MTEGPLAAYRALCANGDIEADPTQRLAAERLQALHRALAGYSPPKKRRGWRRRLGFRGARTDGGGQPVDGLYLYGGAGRGKSMLMDLFFASAPVEKKRRVHFHEFMLEVHERLHGLRSAEGGGGTADPLPKLADEILSRCWLLCFDEFHVVDVADAMILGRLFTALFDLGLVVVATSNWAPDDLYEGGLQRQRFLPFIALLKERMDVLHLAGAQDYRMLGLAGEQVFFTPLDARARAGLERAFEQLTGGAEPAADELLLKGRSLAVPRSARGVAWFTFEELCARPLGAADYLALATHYRAVVLEGVPKLGPEKRNEAKRLIVLIDALYEHRTKLILSSAVPVEEIYTEGTGSGTEFARTVSRLTEMRSEGYIAKGHLS